MYEVEPTISNETISHTLRSGEKKNFNAIPPSRSFILSTIPSSPLQQRQMALLGAAAAAESIPVEFDWRNKGYGGFGKNDINCQYLCGNCWSIASTDCISLRYAIQMDATHPKLSILQMAACDHINSLDISGNFDCESARGSCNKNNGCGGGFPSLALEYAQNVGLSEDLSDVYSFNTWCAAAANCCRDSCNRGADLPAVQNQRLFPACPAPLSAQRFKIKNIANIVVLDDTNTINPQKTIEAIKLEIMRGGPVMAGYIVFKDFQTNDWSKNPVYIKSPNTSIEGGHAIVIVGWGRQKVKGYGDVDYWIVKNSWGNGWGDNGYCKVAISNAAAGINTEILMDVPRIEGKFGNGSNIYFGGVMSFDVVEHPKFPAGVRKIEPNDSSAAKGQKKLILYISLAIVVMIIVYFALKSILRK